MKESSLFGFGLPEAELSGLYVWGNSMGEIKMRTPSRTGVEPSTFWYKAYYSVGIWLAYNTVADVPITRCVT
jgi:hypothetical protein